MYQLLRFKPEFQSVFKLISRTVLLIMVEKSGWSVIQFPEWTNIYKTGTSISGYRSSFPFIGLKQESHAEPTSTN